MAIADNQKLDFLWKKIGYGFAKTDINSVKAAVNESIPSPLLLRGDIIWVDSDLIPNVIPAVSNDIVEVYSDAFGAEPTVECEADITASPNRTWLTNTINWIPPEFGSTYQIKVYIDDPGSSTPQTTGSQIFASGSGNNDEWFFDYSAGILNFIGDNLPAGISGKSIFISGAVYVSDFGVKGQRAELGNLIIEDNDIRASNTDGGINLLADGSGIININNDAIFQDNVDIGSDVTIGGAVDIGNDVTIDGAIDFQTTLTINGRLFAIDDLADGKNDAQENLALGFRSLDNLTADSNYNVVLGNDAGNALIDGSNNILIGNHAEPSSSVVNNEVTIGNETIERVRIPGVDFEIAEGKVIVGAQTSGFEENLLVYGNAKVSQTLEADELKGDIDGGTF